MAKIFSEALNSGTQVVISLEPSLYQKLKKGCSTPYEFLFILNRLYCRSQLWMKASFLHAQQFCFDGNSYKSPN